MAIRRFGASIPGAGPTAAEFVYTGHFAGKCRQYAQKFHSSNWCILSAKYGFLKPDDVVPGPYNVSFNDKSTCPIGITELTEQVSKQGIDRYERIIVLGGSNYVSMTKKVFTSSHILTPLRGCKGIGYMMARLNTSINENEPLC